MISVWKPLRGPVRDWPLALCDVSTVDPDDIQPGDLVYGDYVVENCQLHQSGGQKWYYLRDQGPEEAWVFVQSDSLGSRLGKFNVYQDCLHPMGDGHLSSC